MAKMMMTARTRMMTSIFDATTNLVNGCILGREGEGE
jgi:hypothetical protein